jgi:hypothetical protein
VRSKAAPTPPALSGGRHRRQAARGTRRSHYHPSLCEHGLEAGETQWDEQQAQHTAAADACERRRTWTTAHELAIRRKLTRRYMLEQQIMAMALAVLVEVDAPSLRAGVHTHDMSKKKGHLYDLYGGSA